MGMTLAAAGVLAFSLPQWNASQNFRFLMYLALTLGAANLKVRLPGVTGAISMTFVFILISLPDLSLPQVLLVGLAGTGGTLLFRAKSRQMVKLVFNLAASVVTTFACFGTFHWEWLRRQDGSLPMLLLFASAVHFVVNTGTISIVIALTERKSAWRVWRESFLWTASHNLVGAGIAAVFHVEEKYLGWQATLLTLPVVYLVYRSYSLHLERLEGARKHAQEMGDLHWRTIEALALAIDAKDETTHNHLLRVKVYATEIAKELGLEDLQIQAVQAAALLHDIGKLAVPEHIISKPGKLTREEFGKMKIHPVVGAEILERVRFPYPVAPIVHSHHEKWNGKGYPDGLKGTEIPIGARILSAVDCLDALASDRQYRKALPLDEAMAIVEKESGLSYDPAIVAVLKRRYVELEHMATSLPAVEEPKLSRNIQVDAGDGPACGYADMCVVSPNPVQIDFLESVAVVRREFQSLIRIVEELGPSLTLEETLFLVGKRLKKMIPHNSSAIFVRKGEQLIPVFTEADSECWRPQFTMEVGEGLSGWVAETHQPIVNGNPTVETSYYCPGRALLSAISVPLESSGDVTGLITLYSVTANAFTQDHLRILQQIGPKAGLSILNAMAHESLAA
jgi:putative nucleotidyltransferase with HDIG domain